MLIQPQKQDKNARHKVGMFAHPRWRDQAIGVSDGTRGER